MIGLSDVKQALDIDISVSPEMAEALELWSLLYTNNAPWLNADIKGLGLPAVIAGEIARDVTIEMKVTLSGGVRADFLQEQIDKVVSQLRRQVERGNALGGLVMKPYPIGNRLSTNFVGADEFYPIAFDDDGNLTDCVFSDQVKQGSYYYTRLEYHSLVDEGVLIRNAAFRSSTQDTLGQPIALNTIDEWMELESETLIVGIDRPLYAYFSYPMANNVDPSSPLGISCFARAQGDNINLLRDADELYSNLVWEFKSGKRAIYVDKTAFDTGSDGLPILPDKRLYRPINNTGNIGDNNQMYADWSPEFREAAINSGLDSILKRIELKCGLAYGMISDPQSVEKTATEIKVSKQRYYATVTDVQKALQKALDDLLYAMDVWATLFNLAPRGTYTATYDFDDSLISDHDTQYMQDFQTMGQGAMPKYVFLVRNYGLSEGDAKKWVEEAQAEKPEIPDFFGARDALQNT